jgi:hypothetical protein
VKESKTTVRQYLDQPNLPSFNKKPEGNSSMSTIQGMMNNPVVTTLMKHNPASWIMEVITESGEFKVPSQIDEMMKLLPSGASEGMKTVIDCFTQLFSDLFNSLQQILAKPSDIASILVNQLKSTIIRLYDALADVVGEAMDVIYKFFGLISGFINAEWKIGVFTDVWEEFAGQDFTLLGFITYVTAAVMNLGLMLVRSELPFRDGAMWDDWSNLQLPQLSRLPQTAVSHRMAASTPSQSMDKMALNMSTASGGELAGQGQPHVQTVHKRTAAGGGNTKVGTSSKTNCNWQDCD